MTDIPVQEEFWRWFVLHETTLLRFELDRERIFDELSAALSRVDPDLTFEFGPTDPQREFVVSAGGLKRAFPAVVSLVNAAPKLANWKVTAFRPRRNPLNTVDFQGKSIHPKDVEFSLLDNGQAPGLKLFLPYYEENDLKLKQIAYLMLDDALGEYDVETNLGPIQMLPLDTPSNSNKYPLDELPALFDQLVAKLAAKSKRLF